MNSTCAAEAAVDMCNTVWSNPDISGVGVRTAIYAQTLLNMIAASIMPNNNGAFRDISRNTYVLSFSLIVASIAQWRHGGLSLFDGIVSTMLTTLMTAFVSLNHQYIRTLGVSVNVASLLFTSFWCYWGIQVWVDPWTFGLAPSPPPEVNVTSSLLPTAFSLASRATDPLSAIADCTANLDTVFVVFGKKIPATNHGLRIWALLVFSLGGIGAVMAIWPTLLMTLRYWEFGAHRVKEHEIIKTVNEEQYGGGPQGGKTRVSFMSGFAGLIYMIVTTEQIVQANPSVHNDLAVWTYGQTLGVIMLGVQLTDCVRWWWDSRQYRMKWSGDRARA